VISESAEYEYRVGVGQLIDLRSHIDREAR
jgi:hypothetical protein